MSGRFAEENARYRSEYAAALEPRDFTGKLDAYDDYDGNDDWAGRTWSVHLDEPRGRIVMVELEDVLAPLDGKHVRIRIDVVE